MSVNTTERLRDLRRWMAQHKLDAYYVPGGDAHQSEYIAPCDARRAFISGFTGSAGCAIITPTKAGLWTDGRYFLQAEKQLDANWELVKMGTPNARTKEQWTVDHLGEGATIGVDPSLISHELYSKWQEKFKAKRIQWSALSDNLIDKIWHDRPARPRHPIIALEAKYCGQSSSSKLAKVREYLDQQSLGGGLVVSALDDIAWTLNWRGSDIPYNPVFFAYLWIGQHAITLYVDASKVSNELKQSLTEDVTIKPYSDIFSDLQAWRDQHVGSSLKIGQSSSASYALVFSAGGESRAKLAMSPIANLKAVKNPTEMEGFRQCHARDGAALCRYFAWLEDQLVNHANGSISEVDGADMLERFRGEQPLFKGLSFDTISSVGANAAVIHYKPQSDTASKINTREVYLCDSGGQYLDGTTDVTRTLHFGVPTEREKTCYTLVLKGQIALGRAVFPEKTSGLKLDILARQYLWSYGLDYRHGTGHGVGHFLNVHEGPQGISARPEYNEIHFVEGMVLSNEPGYYEDGKFGFRLENIIMVRKLAMREPTFANVPYFGFETVTMVPFHKSLIELSLLNKEEIGYLDDYHKTVHETLSPLLGDDPLALNWLKRQTGRIEGG